MLFPKIKPHRFTVYLKICQICRVTFTQELETNKEYLRNTLAIKSGKCYFQCSFLTFNVGEMTETNLAKFSKKLCFDISSIWKWIRKFFCFEVVILNFFDICLIFFQVKFRSRYQEICSKGVLNLNLKIGNIKNFVKMAFSKSSKPTKTTIIF